MKIQDLNGKSICILGYGREGRAMASALERHAPNAEITIADENPKMHEPKYTTQMGDVWLENLDRFDVLIKSPGIPPNTAIEAHRSKLTSSTQIFFDTVEEVGCTIIGVTGTKGKSTTSSLLAAVLQADGRDAHLVGNIGDPVISHIASATPETIFILEMSSYQLADLRSSPSIAIVVSFYPDHLDYHGSLEAYLEAKKNICRFQKPGDAVYYQADSEGAKAIAAQSPGKRVPFNADLLPLEKGTMALRGEHNRSNAAAAYLVCKDLGVNDAVSLPVIQHFQGLPHRLQEVSRAHGIVWIDDAISTTPESTIAGLHALGNDVHAVILGGQDRGYDFEALAVEINNRAKLAILLPESGRKIRTALEALPERNVEYVDVETLQDGVSLAREKTPTGAICLLSPASPSYNQFTNFEEKGEAFARAILKE